MKTIVKKKIGKRKKGHIYHLVESEKYNQNYIRKGQKTKKRSIVKFRDIFRRYI